MGIAGGRPGLVGVRCLSAGVLLVCLGSAAGAQSDVPDATATIESGVPLHITTVRTAAMRVGTAVEGVLTEPIFVHDQLILPKGTVVRGAVTALVPEERSVRTRALLDGDVTPLHEPLVQFRSLTVGTEEVAFTSTARVRQARLVEFVPQKKQTLREKASAAVHERISSTREQFLSPGKKDRAMRLLYSQLPYHPQRIWAGTGMIADLDQPLTLRPAAQDLQPVGTATTASLDKIAVRARLVTALSSDTSHRGDPVRAIVSTPVFDTAHKLVLAEGAELAGTVAETKPSRSLGRNGSLRFVFQSVERTGEADRRLHGIVTGAEAANAENLTVDAEGQAKANPDRNRFIAPLLLAVTAAAGRDRDSDGGVGRSAVASNGFGLVARVVSIAVNDKNVSTGFGAYGFAKSVYFRFLQRGHAVTFPKDTLVDVQLSGR